PGSTGRAVRRGHLKDREVDIHVLHDSPEAVVQRLRIDSDRRQAREHLVAASLAALEPAGPEAAAQLFPPGVAYLGEIRVQRNLEWVLAKDARAERVNGAKKCTIDVVQCAIAEQPCFTLGIQLAQLRFQLDLEPLPQLVGGLSGERDSRDALYGLSTQYESVHASDQRRRLAGAGACLHEHVTVEIGENPLSGGLITRRWCVLVPKGRAYVHVVSCLVRRSSMPRYASMVSAFSRAHSARGELTLPY